MRDKASIVYGVNGITDLCTARQPSNFNAKMRFFRVVILWQRKQRPELPFFHFILKEMATEFVFTELLIYSPCPGIEFKQYILKKGKKQDKYLAGFVKLRVVQYNQTKLLWDALTILWLTLGDYVYAEIQRSGTKGNPTKCTVCLAAAFWPLQVIKTSHIPSQAFMYFIEFLLRDARRLQLRLHWDYL